MRIRKAMIFECSKCSHIDKQPASFDGLFVGHTTDREAN